MPQTWLQVYKITLCSITISNIFNACIESNPDVIDIFTGQTLKLFNLAADPEERTNLAVNQSDTAQRMLARLLEVASSIANFESETEC